MKQNLKLGKNRCRDFAGQIAGVSLCILQYNILSYVKRNGLTRLSEDSLLKSQRTLLNFQ